MIYSLSVDRDLGLQAIADHLNAREIESPSASAGTKHRRKSDRWAKSSVFKVLTYRGYCGRLTYNVRITKLLNGKNKVVGTRPRDEQIAIAVPAILDNALFETAQTKLRQRKILSDRNKMREYLCGGLLHCE